MASSMDGSWTLLFLANRKSPGDFGAFAEECSHTSGGEKVEEMEEKVLDDPSTLVEVVLHVVDELRFAGETEPCLTKRGTIGDGSFRAFDGATGATSS